MISVYFDPIVPEPFRESVIRVYLLNEARKISTEIKKDFDLTAKTWDHKPKFKKEVGFGAKSLKIEVSTDDALYAIVSEGSEGKPRVARGAGLAIDGKPRALTLIPYIPKTTPGELEAKSGGPDESQPTIFRKYALNAGKIRPRKFDDLVFEIWDEKLPERLQEALEAAAQKTGYTF